MKDQLGNQTLLDPLDDWRGASLNRRDLLRRGFALGIAGMAGSSLLAACGGDDDDDESASNDTLATSEETQAESEATDEETSEETESSGASTSAEGGETEAASEDETQPESANAGTATELADEQVVRLPTTEPIGLDPGVSYGYALDIFRNIWEGLVDIDPRNQEVTPHLAESFEANDDATAYTFTLKEGLTWSDGEPLHADAFVYTYKRILQPETASQYIPALYPIKGVQDAVEGNASIDDIGVEAVDDLTLEITLAGATPYFPLLATTWTYYPVPQHVIEEKGADWYEAGNLVTTGPFILSEWNHNQNIILEQNPNYWGETPTLTRMEYTIFDDEVAQSLVPYQADELGRRAGLRLRAQQRC